MNSVAEFSVLMSLYAKEQPEFLTQCLHSLQQQTLPATEIIIVFDGSIGKELQQCVAQFAHTLPIRVCPLPENVGLAKALNHGLAHCRCEWVLRMDTDDICVPERFVKQWAFLQQYPDLAISGGLTAEFSRTPNCIDAVKTVPLTHNEIMRYSRKRNPFNHMTVAYRKTAVLAVGGYRHHLFMEDYQLWLRLLAAGYRSGNLPEVLVYARAGQAMYRRRRGWRYVKSEWQLCCIKQQLHFQAALPALFTFVARSAGRLLPETLLARVYRRLRKH
ncbi:glycosyltransferase [Stenoxybacter acetivorans]|uniref:glycosyltransferase n=1 Tax=Stenoxybacter acetivorans TaxID=422441 RepID=UPI00055BD729|nr:glycosyltransferase [Stenoxybacter acetivorans]